MLLLHLVPYSAGALSPSVYNEFEDEVQGRCNYSPAEVRRRWESGLVVFNGFEWDAFFYVCPDVRLLCVVFQED